MRHHRFRLLCGIFLLLACQIAWTGDAVTRMNFLLNFSRFIDWDAATLGPTARLHLCIAPGDLELARETSALERAQIHGHAIQVVLPTRAVEVAGCHVLFLPAELPLPLEPFLSAAERAGALTVSDFPGFADRGGMIELQPANGHYRFDINLGAVKRARLYMSTNLLKLARTVH